MGAFRNKNAFYACLYDPLENLNTDPWSYESNDQRGKSISGHRGHLLSQWKQHACTSHLPLDADLHVAGLNGGLITGLGSVRVQNNQLIATVHSALSIKTMPAVPRV